MRKGLIFISLTLILALTGIPAYAVETEATSGSMNRYTDISGHWA